MIMQHDLVIDRVKILRLIESNPLTVQNLADSLDVSVKDVSPIMRQLFKGGFIDRSDASFLRKIFPFIRSNRHRETDITNPDMHLTLTSKGYFKLNPVITIGGGGSN